MPLNRPALTLGRGPRGVQDARRWVTGTFGDIGRDDLLECAEVGVSELVTNALLHASGPIQVRVRGTREHPRVEVRDTSTEPPVLPSETVESDEDLLLTFGRGLSIVARASKAWGADVDDDGKVVWFAPAAEFSDDAGPVGRITGEVEPSPDTTGDVVDVRLLGVPVADFVAFEHHFRELRREVRLLSMAHESDYPLAKDLTEIFDAHGRMLGLGTGNDRIDEALARGEVTTDLVLPAARSHASAVVRFIDLLELTDAFGREERMLSLARTPEQHAFQSWFLGEFVSQAAGSAPRAWTTQQRPARTRVP